MKKKILSLIVAISMAINILPAMAFANSKTTNSVKTLSAMKQEHFDLDTLVQLSKESVIYSYETSITKYEKQRDAFSDSIDSEIKSYKKKLANKPYSSESEYNSLYSSYTSEINTLNRRIAALAGDNSSSARAQRAKLQAQLQEIQLSLEELKEYKSIESTIKALENEKEIYVDQKNSDINWYKEKLNDEEFLLKRAYAWVDNPEDNDLFNLCNKVVNKKIIVINEILITEDNLQKLYDNGMNVKITYEMGSKECLEYLAHKIEYYVSSVTVSTSKYTYDGYNHLPAITVKDAKGNTLKKGTDYTTSYPSSRWNVGRYKITVTMKGNYSGTFYRYYTIVPKAAANTKANLYGYDDVKVTWTKAKGASGYFVYYKKSTSSSYTYYSRTTGTSMKFANLTDGVKYNFKVVPYYYSSANDTRYTSLQSSVASVYTLKQLSAPTVTRNGTKVKVKWTNINGESGYQISRSTSKTGTNIVLTNTYTTGTYNNVSATKGKGYYYKVRAYKTVNGTKIYAPWSSVKYYKR